MSAWTSAVAALATQPLLWWRMDSGGANETNLGSTGATDAGAVGINIVEGATSLLVGDTDGAMSFAGTAAASASFNDCVSANDAVNFQPTGALTLAAIINATAWSGANGSTLFAYAGGDGVAAYGFYVNPGGVLHGYIDSTGGVHKNVLSATTLSTGTIYYVVFTWDGTTMRLYINGAQDANTTACSGITYVDTSVPGFGVGSYSNGGGFFDQFNGVIDEAMMFNVALSSGDVANLYAGMQGGLPQSSFQSRVVGRPALGSQTTTEFGAPLIIPNPPVPPVSGFMHVADGPVPVKTPGTFQWEFAPAIGIANAPPPTVFGSILPTPRTIVPPSPPTMQWMFAPPSVARTTTQWSRAVNALTTQPVLWWRNDATTATQANSGSTGATDAGAVGANVVESAASLLVNDPDTAMTFPGTASNTLADTVSVVDVTNLQPTTAFSIGALVKPSAFGTNGLIIAAYSGATAVASYLFGFLSGGQLHGFIDTTASVHLNVQSAAALVIGTVYHVVFTWDGTTMRLYINGVVDVNTTACSAIIYTDDTTFKFTQGGYSVAGFYNAFAGQIDELMVFKNYALTQAEILTLFNATGLTPAAPSRSAYFNLTSRAPIVRTPPTFTYEAGPPLIITNTVVTSSGFTDIAKRPAPIRTPPTLQYEFGPTMVIPNPPVPPISGFIDVTNRPAPTRSPIALPAEFGPTTVIPNPLVPPLSGFVDVTNRPAPTRAYPGLVTMFSPPPKFVATGTIPSTATAHILAHAVGFAGWTQSFASGNVGALGWKASQATAVIWSAS